MDKNSTIFIAGGTGLVGQACVRQFQQCGYTSILAPSRQELDLADAQAVGAYFQQHNVDIVVLAAGKVGGILENKNNPVDFLNVNRPACVWGIKPNRQGLLVCCLNPFRSGCLIERACYGTSVKLRREIRFDCFVDLFCGHSL